MIDALKSSRWVRDGEDWVAVCPPFSHFGYDEARFAAAIVDGRRRFFNRPPRRAGLVRFGHGPSPAELGAQVRGLPCAKPAAGETS